MKDQNKHSNIEYAWKQYVTCMHSALWFGVYPYDNDGTEHYGRCLENITSLHLWKENEDKNLKFKKLKKLKCQKRLKKLKTLYFDTCPFLWKCFGSRIVTEGRAMDGSALWVAKDLVVDWMGTPAFPHYLISPPVYSIICGLIE